MKNEYRRFLEAATKRRVEARKLREKGLSYTEIGQKLEITRQRAWQIAQPILRRNKETPSRRHDDVQRGTVG